MRLLSLAPSQDVLRPVDLFPPSEIRGEVSSCLSLQGLLPQIYRSLRCCESEVNLWRPRSACWRKSRSELDCLFSQITAPLGGFWSSLTVPKKKKKKEKGWSTSPKERCCKFRNKFSHWRHMHTLLPWQTRESVVQPHWRWSWWGWEGVKEGGGSSRKETEVSKKKKIKERKKERLLALRRTCACCSSVAAESLGEPGGILFMNGGELRLSLRATAIWAASNPFQ